MSRKENQKMDSFLRIFGSLLYGKALELKDISDDVAARYNEIAPGKIEIENDLESSFQKVIASTLGCVSDRTPPKTRESLAFWTLISNQELDRWEIVELVNKHELVIDGQEVDNKKLSKYLNEFKNDLEICIAIKYYSELNRIMPNMKAKKILYIVLKDRGHFDIIIDFAKIAIQLNRHQSAITLLYFAHQISPDNQQGKQILVEVFPEAIQEFIDENRYEDAFSLYKKAQIIDNKITLDISLEKTYELKVEKTIINVNKVWSFSKNMIKLKLGDIVNGIGELFLYASAQPLGASKGVDSSQKNNNGEEYLSAKLNIDEKHVNISIKDNLLFVQSDHSIDIALVDDNGKAIIGDQVLGEATFVL